MMPGPEGQREQATRPALATAGALVLAVALLQIAQQVIGVFSPRPAIQAALVISAGFAALTAERKRAAGRGSLGKVGVISGVVCVVALCAAGVIWAKSGFTARPQPVNRPLAPMDGDLNVAVMPFTTNGHTGHDGLSLARDTYTVLRSDLARLDPHLHIEFRGPDAIGTIGTTRPPTQPTDQAALARRLNADLVVYGDLLERPMSTTLNPRFYVNELKLSSATELAGQYSFGEPVTVPFAISTNPQSRASLRRALLSRATTFAASFVGVGYYLSRQFGAAARYFMRALTLTRAPHSRATFLIFLGNIANQRSDPPLAARYYRSALRLYPGYGRAQFGLAEVQYVLARRSCASHDVNAAGLYRAQRAFNGVSMASLQGSSPAAPAALRAKVQFGVAQVDLCLSQARVSNRWRYARSEFTAVVRDYAVSRPELRDDTAEAHAGLGLIDLETTPRRRAAFMAARREYEAAASITTIARRGSFFLAMTGLTDERLGDHAAAAAAYQHAAALAPTAAASKRYAAAAQRNRLKG